MAAGPAIAGPLETWRWERRLLVVFADSADAPRLVDQKERISADPTGVADRRLLLVTVIGDAARSADGDRLDAAALRERFGVASGFAALLIGLDGGEKARSSTAAFALSDLFQRIDRMPMRRNELEGRGNE